MCLDWHCQTICRDCLGAGQGLTGRWRGACCFYAYKNDPLPKQNHGRQSTCAYGAGSTGRSASLSLARQSRSETSSFGQITEFNSTGCNVVPHGAAALLVVVHRLPLHLVPEPLESLESRKYTDALCPADALGSGACPENETSRFFLFSRPTGLLQRSDDVM